jgi:predicted Na+-dependent transporter
MLGDILIAVVIIVIAALLGILVHPLLWLILIVAALWLFSRRGTRTTRV